MKFSVITPVYNRADSIIRCLDSVTRNIGKRKDVEHIVVDDGSSDNTPQLIRKYADEKSHVRCVFFSNNQGTNAARNAAISVAIGDFCVILDSDDYWDDSALDIIDGTVSAHPDIRYFCFAPDDMQSDYDHIPLLAKKESALLSYEDFLLGRVAGDFVHVMSTEVIKRHPFDEKLRIYEGVFFLAFYKETENILFSNRVVSHRERGRSDSVTRETFRTSREIILRTIMAESLYVDKYAGELNKSEEGSNCLWKHRVALLDNYILLGEYDNACHVINDIEKSGNPVVPFRLKWICRLRLGNLYFCFIRLYLQIKYNVLHIKVK